MTGTPRILLIDDGELAEVAAMLDRLEIPHTRLRGGMTEGELSPPSDLLIATPRRAGAVRRGSPPGARSGRPQRIIAVDEDSTAMRRMLRRMGFHLLIRRGAHPDVWRLVVERALFEGSERRTDPRRPVGAAVSFASAGDPERAVTTETAPDVAVLLDISNRGCRLTTPNLLDPGSRLVIEIPLDEQGGEILRLRGRLVRTHMVSSQSGRHTCTAGMLFDTDLEEDERMRLGRLLNELSVGPGSLPSASADPLPACASPDIPGLTLDDETDPALLLGVEVGMRRTDRVSTPESSSPAAAHADHASNRRHTPRASYEGQVLALAKDTVPASRVLMGRDLSAGGMRIEYLPDIHVGDRLQLAVYGPAQQHPFLVDSIVDRDDGEDGLALRFVDVSDEVAKGLEKLVACLPDIESLEDGEAHSLGAVISEVLARNGRR